MSICMNVIIAKIITIINIKKRHPCNKIDHLCQLHQQSRLQMMERLMVVTHQKGIKNRYPLERITRQIVNRKKLSIALAKQLQITPTAKSLLVSYGKPYEY